VANYVDDIETGVAAVLTAYAAMCTVLADDQPSLEALRCSIFADLMPIASGVALEDFCAKIRHLGGTSVAAVQAGLDAGVGDYTP
jgi:hypothetical protein